ncbi:MAG: vWA domain-containing protein [Actinomycetota bacterium]
MARPHELGQDVGARRGGGRRPGKSPEPPEGGADDDERILTGDEAAQALADERRRTISRRELARQEGFAEVSPDLGELDQSAFDDLFTEDSDAALDLLARMAQATDGDLAKLARRLAGRLVLDLARTGRAKTRGVGKLTTIRADRSDGDLDIDDSIDALVAARAEGRPPAIDELRATYWQKPGTAICLLVDRSGSMNGERLASAALAAAVCSWRAPAEFSVLAFGDKVVTIKGLDQHKGAEEVVAEVLALRGHGTTDVALALRAANRQLAPSRATRKLTVLLSDAEVTTGDDPLPAARGLDELVALAPADEPQHARALIDSCGGRLAEVAGPMSVLDALRIVVQ